MCLPWQMFLNSHVILQRFLLAKFLVLDLNLADRPDPTQDVFTILKETCVFEGKFFNKRILDQLIFQIDQNG
jgi:hypothetical protein